MNRRFVLANAILWATAIVVSALLRAPATLTLIFLPSLATVSLLMTSPRPASPSCRG